MATTKLTNVMNVMINRGVFNNLFDTDVKNILILGNMNGLFGPSMRLSITDCSFDDIQNWLNNRIKSDAHITVLTSDKGTYDYFNKIKDEIIKHAKVDIFDIKPLQTDTEMLDELLELDKYNMGKRFDYIIMNPPYDGSLHLHFLNRAIDYLKEDGKLTCIQPSRWLIDLAVNGTYNTGKSNNPTLVIKNKIKGHIKSIILDNYNKDFNVKVRYPFSITNIDMSKTFDNIEFDNHGIKSFESNINDCNLIGKRATINSILSKVASYGDMLKSHITTMDEGDGMWYIKTCDLFGEVLCSIGNNNHDIDSDHYWIKTAYGKLHISYSSLGYYYVDNDIQDHIHYRLKSGGRDVSTRPADMIFGTKDQMENWKHFVFNNKLYAFIAACQCIAPGYSTFRQYFPFIADKKYTDDEINEMFGFTSDEIDLINKTIDKISYGSRWFKRVCVG